MKREEQCSNCGKLASVVRRNHQFDEMGIPVVLERIEVVKCPHCGNVDPIIPNLNDLMHAIALLIICHPCKLTGEELRFLRKYAGKTQEEFGRLIHLDKTHVSKMENSQVPVGDQTDKLVRFVVLNSSPELEGKVQQLLDLLPMIEDTCDDGKPGICIDPATMEAQYAY
jgi:DNA-binding transcriptional regulator YiaG